MKKALHFGGGNIGRGFIGKLLADAGYEVVFADVNPLIIDALNKDKKYSVRIVGDGVDKVEEVNSVRGIFSNNQDELDREIADCDLITTAVGPTVLEIIAPSLAKALTLRLSKNPSKKLNLIACENMVRASSFLKDKVLAAATNKDLIENNIGFVDSAVDRIVPPVGVDKDNPLFVTVEVFCEWIVDKTQFKGELPEIEGMITTDNLMAFVERKLFTLNTGHATTAYIGKLKGKATVKDAIEDLEIKKVVQAVMEESGEVLIKRYNFEREKHLAYIQKILKRFTNPYLHDDVDRVGRQPLRKLSPNDRLVKPLNGMLEYGTSHQATVKAIAAALKYQNSEDPQAVELQDFIAKNGVEAAIKNYCQLDNQAVIEEIVKAFNS